MTPTAASRRPAVKASAGQIFVAAATEHVEILLDAKRQCALLFVAEKAGGAAGIVKKIVMTACTLHCRMGVMVEVYRQQRPLQNGLRPPAVQSTAESRHGRGEQAQRQGSTAHGDSSVRASG